ncbi:VanZ family protein [Streptomyces sp. M2CJ-2]|uniref:VanZ family protein n=1 Tax=Streptomyces sp. M2CJ-2 TaxID=2803948 RepID=UPI0019208F55|nr:VanZ family protein [Streptomyces sp. M2CJ-2]MBL3666070.1 VanZ family protein [Streptomyces sp. M2CJ-2]
MPRTASHRLFGWRRTPGSGPGTAPGARSKNGGPRPLPLPIRLLAMLCAFTFMVVFAMMLARLTLQPSPASEALIHTNLRPGRSLRAYLDQPALRDAVRQVGGNILLGMPFGLLAPVVAPRTRGFLRVLLLTGSVMLMVEFAQGAMITGRAFDIDDVILNTSGALIGYLLLGRRLSRAVHARRPKADARPSAKGKPKSRGKAEPLPEAEPRSKKQV